jgi:hypothetical protein
MVIRHLVLSMLLVGLSATAFAQRPETFGAGVSLEDTTPLVRVIERPADFEGKTVRVEGTVTAVCMHMGCWMALSDTVSGSRTLMIKVDDGVIVFPPRAKGRRAVAEGVVQRVGSQGENREAASEHARATGGGAAAPVSWQLKATGALVYLE